MDPDTLFPHFASSGSADFFEQVQIINIRQINAEPGPFRQLKNANISVVKIFFYFGLDAAFVLSGKISEIHTGEINTAPVVEITL